MRGNKLVQRLLVLCFWCLVWQGSVMLANRHLLLPLPTPLSVLKAVVVLAERANFRRSLAGSVLRVTAGFCLALLAGTLGGVAAFRSRVFALLSELPVRLLRATPVAALTIVVFLWVRREQIPAVIVLFTVMPIVWENVQRGLEASGRELEEMARVFGMPRVQIWCTILLPGIRNYLLSAVDSGLGFAWKAGVAAEIICRTSNSLGNLLWASKSTVDYDEVFALTLIIVLLSSALQALAGRLFRKERVL